MAELVGNLETIHISVDGKLNRVTAWGGISGDIEDQTDLIEYVEGEVGEVGNELDEHIADTSNPHSVTKAQVGLSDVDNTTDLNKPISIATQTALNAKQDSLPSPTAGKYLRSNPSSGNLEWDDAEATGAVRYDEYQNLNNSQKTQARNNISAQETLVSGTNIKTINNQTILGNGNLNIDSIEDVKVNGTTVVSNKVANVLLKTVNNKSLVGSGNVDLTDPIVENAKTEGGIGWITGSTQTITWNGNITGKTTLDNSICKISDQVPDNNHLPTTASYYNNGTAGTLTISGFYKMLPDLYISYPGGWIWVAYKDVVYGGFTFTKGTYSKYADVTGEQAASYVSSIELYIGDVHKIKNKFLEIPILDNAQANGGIGWTDNNSYSLSWDGDTSGKSSVGNAYKISDNVPYIPFPPETNVINVKLTYLKNGTETVKENLEMQQFWYAPNLYMNSGTYTTVYFALEDTSYWGTQIPKGVYFGKTNSNTYVKSVLYSDITDHQIDGKYLTGKQDKLISGTTIKTINNTSILGEGNINTIDSALESAKTNGGIGWTETTTTTWDGNTTGKTIVAESFCKITTDVPSSTSSFPQTAIIYAQGVEQSFDISEVEEAATNLYICGYKVIFALENVTVEGMTFEKGTYFMFQYATEGQASVYVKSITYGGGTTHTIAGQFIPSKQDVLVSGTNIKTINNTSILGSGNLSVSVEWEDLT